MSFNTRKVISFCSLFLVAFYLTGCPKSQVKDDSIPSAVDADQASGDSDSGNAMGLQTVHFAYDSFSLDGESRGVLRSNAQILKDNAGVNIQIEGHCDERGGIQYNLALGEKRANAVRNYLMDLGVSGDRITIISFGEERPVDPGHTEEAWAKNRRGNFVITSR